VPGFQDHGWKAGPLLAHAKQVLPAAGDNFDPPAWGSVARAKALPGALFKESAGQQQQECKEGNCHGDEYYHTQYGQWAPFRCGLRAPKTCYQPIEEKDGRFRQ